MSEQGPLVDDGKVSGEAEKNCQSGTRIGVCTVIAIAVFGLAYGVVGRQKTSDSEVLGIPAEFLRDKPLGDSRVYQAATLPNGIKVVTVQDPQSMQAAFSLTVDAGQFDDPRRFPGLAHFCEHMVFLGTERYPDPDGFDAFMSSHGGSDNAYTAKQVTNYYGSVSHDAIDAALDRFSDFFRAPIFNRSFVEREVHAIDSEHAKNVQDPTSRVLAVLYSLANPASPVSQFHTGNLETLYEWPIGNGSNPVDALQVYFEDHYCPSKMHLVMFGPRDSSEQLRLALEKFGDIPAGNTACRGSASNWARPAPWSPQRLQQWVTIQGNNPQASLWMHFPLEDLTVLYRSQPMVYIEYVITYSGNGGLQRILVDDLGLVTSISPLSDDSSAGSQFFLAASLTPLGREHTDLIMDIVFAYLAILQRDGVDEDLYASLKNVSRLTWDWAEQPGAQSTVSDLSERMTRMPPAEVLSGDSLVAELDPRLVESLIKQLQPENMNVAFVDPDAAASMSSSTELPHFGVEYAVEGIDARLPGAAERWSSWLSGSSEEEITSAVQNRLTAAGFSAATFVVPRQPQALRHVPSDLNLDNMHVADVPEDANPDLQLYGPRPEEFEAEALLLQSGSGDGVGEGRAMLQTYSKEVWFRRGWKSVSPKALVQVALRRLQAPGEAEASALTSARLEMYSKLLGEHLTPQMADLVATGVSYTVSASTGGFSFSFSGFTPMLPQLIQRVIEEFNTFNRQGNAAEEARFARLKTEWNESLSTYSDMPVSYALADRNLMFQRGPHSRVELRTALDEVTLDSARSSVREFVLSKPLHLTSLIMGNLAETDAQAAISAIASGIELPEGTVVEDPAADARVEHVKRVVQAQGPVELRVANPREGDDNDVVVLSVFGGVTTVESRALFNIIGSVLQQTAYSYLRTEKQLGYVVTGGASIMSNVDYVSIIIQGNRLNADEAEAAAEYVFSTLVLAKLRELSDEDFASLRGAYLQELAAPPTGPSDEVSHFWGPVQNGGHCFSLHDLIVQYVNDTMTSRDLLVDAYERLVLPSTGVRRKVAVKYFAGSVPSQQNLTAAEDMWRKQKVPDEHVALMIREREAATVLDKVDSTTREQLLEAGSYYSTDLKCSLASSSDSAAGLAAEKMQLVDADEDSSFMLERRLRHGQAQVALGSD